MNFRLARKNRRPFALFLLLISINIAVHFRDTLLNILGKKSNPFNQLGSGTNKWPTAFLDRKAKSPRRQNLLGTARPQHNKGPAAEPRVEDYSPHQADFWQPVLHDGHGTNMHFVFSAYWDVRDATPVVKVMAISSTVLSSVDFWCHVFFNRSDNRTSEIPRRYPAKRLVLPTKTHKKR